LGSDRFPILDTCVVAVECRRGICLAIAVETGERLDVKRQGKVVVSRSFLEAVANAERDSRNYQKSSDWFLARNYSYEARRIVNEHGGSRDAVENEVRDAVHRHGVQDFVTEQEAEPGISVLYREGASHRCWGPSF
jgi:hypothetical protein